MTITETWVELANRLIRAGGTVILIGRTDSGKTTLCRYLAQEAVGRGMTTAIVDTDIGQSWIGPPTCIGLRICRGEIDLSSPDRIWFVGAISPIPRMLDCVIGAKEMVDEAKASGADFILIDTTGLVDGREGADLKRAKISIIRPTDIVLIQSETELEPIAREFENFDTINIHRIKRSRHVKRRDQPYRSRYRNDKLGEYFFGCSPVRFGFGELRAQRTLFLNGTPANRAQLDRISSSLGEKTLYAEFVGRQVFAVTVDPVPVENIKSCCSGLRWDRMEIRQKETMVGTIVGLLDRSGRSVGIGVLTEIDFASRELAILCHESAAGECSTLSFSWLAHTIKGC